MKHALLTRVVCVAIIAIGLAGCRSDYHSAFADQAMRANQLAKLKYKTLKTGAVGVSHGFKFLWIPFASPSEADAKQDMLEQLQKEGITTSGKNIGFANATADKGGFGFIGLIGTPKITLTADVIEILGEAPAAPAVNP